jgi:hypothetical protein
MEYAESRLSGNSVHQNTSTLPRNLTPLRPGSLGVLDRAEESVSGRLGAHRPYGPS